MDELISLQHKRREFEDARDELGSLRKKQKEFDDALAELAILRNQKFTYEDTARLSFAEAEELKELRRKATRMDTVIDVRSSCGNILTSLAIGSASGPRGRGETSKGSRYGVGFVGNPGLPCKRRTTENSSGTETASNAGRSNGSVEPQSIAVRLCRRNLARPLSCPMK